MNDLCFIDKAMLLSDTFTYVSQSHHTTSWLDHCITTGAGKSIVSKMHIIDNIICSDHMPLCIEIECDIVPIYVTVHLLKSHVMFVSGIWLEIRKN